MVDEHRSPEWYVIDVCVGRDELDALSGALWSAGIAGIEERRAGTLTKLEVAVPAQSLEAVEAVLGQRSRHPRPVEADTGQDCWRSWATPARIGRVLIEPAWLAGTEGETSTGDAVVVRIDPRRAFGSGSHVTTRLALELLQACDLPGRSVLDVGTGSGVLAIAAASLGATPVVAIDVDEEATRASRANIGLNQVDEVVDVVHGSPDHVEGHFDIVVANIDRAGLVEAAPQLVRLARPTGQLVLSGFLSVSEPDVVRAFPGWSWTRRAGEKEWLAVVGERPDVRSSVSAGRPPPGPGRSG